MKPSRFMRKVVSKTNDFLFSKGLKKVNTQLEGSRVLVYHGVVENALKKINARFISTKEFEAQLQFFKRHFQVVPLKEIHNQTTANHPFRISITFDDGYLNNLNEVLPLLEKYEVPATFFITTIRKSGYDYLWADLLDLYRYTGPRSFYFEGQLFKKKRNEYASDQGQLKHQIKNSGWELKKALCDFILKSNCFVDDPIYASYLNLMSEESIRTLGKSPFVEIGSHGVYHNCLTKIDLKNAEWELKESKRYLEEILQKDIEYMAYPDGQYNATLINIAEKIGYRQQAIVDFLNENDRKDLRLIERLGIHPYIGLNYQMNCIINGQY